MNNIEVYDTTTHVGSNLVAAAKILAGKDYRENEEFTYSFEDYVSSCYINTTANKIYLGKVEEPEQFEEPDYEWLADVANGR